MSDQATDTDGATVDLTTPLTEEQTRSLKAGDLVRISGVIYTARDAAHKKICDLIDEGRDNELPFDPEGQIIYFVGPTPTREGRVIGSAGPTTAYRMDAYSPKLIARGLRGMIGKGGRSEDVRDALQRYGAVYFGATGGAAALIAGRIQESEVIAYPELGPEAVRRMVVEDFPAIVVHDASGGNLLEEGRAKYRRKAP
ncbi:Fe-S-containing hydro-lyase, partial [bacterium]|nr:Fe-S-containing hydro-lyase [bacterium]